MQTDWSKYGHCPTCDQTPGGPCFDMRYVRNGRPVGGFHRNIPHNDRELIGNNLMDELEVAKVLTPFMQAGMTALERTRWMPGQPAEDLVAPIVAAVLVAVAKELNIEELKKTLDQVETDSGNP